MTLSTGDRVSLPCKAFTGGQITDSRRYGAVLAVRDHSAVVQFDDDGRFDDGGLREVPIRDLASHSVTVTPAASESGKRKGGDGE